MRLDRWIEVSTESDSDRVSIDNPKSEYQVRNLVATAPSTDCITLRVSDILRLRNSNFIDGCQKPDRQGGLANNPRPCLRAGF